MATYTLQVISFIILSIFHPSLQQQHQLSAVDLAALLSIKDSLIDLPGSTFFSSWTSTTPDPCSSFEGVTCSVVEDSLRVTTLALGSGLVGSGLGLAGMLPGPSLAELTELTQLILNPGLVTGPVPSELGRLANLRVLSLAHNRLTGPIPAFLSGLSGLHTLDLGFNRLTGPIPPGLLTELTHLKVLILSGNQLTGELPESTQQVQLFHLDLKSNHLVGPILPTLPLSLRYLSLSENQMWGPLTSNGLTSLSELVYLDLSVNQFSGTVPPSLFRPSLSTLLLNHNNLSGNVIVENPDNDVTVITYPEGSVIDLSHNALSGTIPEALAGAEALYLNNNRFSGPVPRAYAEAVVEGSIKTLYLQHNFLDTFPKNSALGELPVDVDICLAYNCMVPPVGLGLESCPTNAGNQLSRPAEQCSVFHNN